MLPDLSVESTSNTQDSDQFGSLAATLVLTKIPSSRAKRGSSVNRAVYNGGVLVFVPCLLVDGECMESRKASPGAWISGRRSRAMQGISKTGTRTTWVTWTWLLLAATSATASPLPEGSVVVAGSSLEAADPKNEGPGIVERLKPKNSDGLSVVQSALLNFLRPMPIVDTITEEEKYGNDGDKFNRVGKSIVGGVEKVSEFVNKVTNIPVESVKKLSRGATEVLNNIGGRLVGLQR